MIIDSHCHAWRVWPYDSAAPGATHRGNVDQLLYEMDANGVDTAFVVCAQIGDGRSANLDNNDYVSRAADICPDRLFFAVDVDSVWSASYHTAGAAERLRAAVVRYPSAVGLTHYLGDTDDGWLVSADGRSFFAAAEELGLIASISAPPVWQRSLQIVAHAHPDLVLIMHHLGGLAVTAKDYAEDVRAVLAGAEHENVFVKISGFHYATELAWEFPYREAWPIVGNLVAAYGAERLMWGSDYPAALGKVTYRQSLEMVKSQLPFLTVQQRNEILGGTARRVFTGVRSGRERPAGGK